MPELNREDLVKALTAAGVGAGAGTLGEYLLRGRISGAGTALGAAAGLGGVAALDQGFRDSGIKSISNVFAPGAETKKQAPAIPPADKKERTYKKNLAASKRAERIAAIKARQARAQARYDAAQVAVEDQAQVDTDAALTGQAPPQSLQEKFDAIEQRRAQLDPATRRQYYQASVKELQEIEPYKVHGASLGTAANMQVLPDKHRQALLPQFGVLYRAAHGKAPSPQDYQMAERVLATSMIKGGLNTPAGLWPVLYEAVGSIDDPRSWKDYSSYERTKDGLVVPKGFRPEGTDYQGVGTNMLESIIRDPEMFWSIGASVAPGLALRTAGLLARGKNAASALRTTGVAGAYNAAKAAPAGVKALASKLGVPLEIADSIIDLGTMMAIDPKTGKSTFSLEDFNRNVAAKSPMELAQLREVASTLPQIVTNLQHAYDAKQAGRMSKKQFNEVLWASGASALMAPLTILMQASNVPRPITAYYHGLTTKGTTLQQRVRANAYYNAVKKIKLGLSPAKELEQLVRLQHPDADDPRRGITAAILGTAATDALEPAGGQTTKDMQAQERRDLYRRMARDARRLNNKEVNQLVQATDWRAKNIWQVPGKLYQGLSENIPVIEGINDQLGRMGVMFQRKPFSMKVKEILRRAQLRNARQAAAGNRFNQMFRQ